MNDLNSHEEKFAVHPVGVRYRCEFCEQGEMKFIGTPIGPIQGDATQVTLFTHRCTKCGKTMKLPKMYPYIDWEPA